jgi:hypothetical protein
VLALAPSILAQMLWTRHLGRGAAGEGHQQNATWVNAVDYQIQGNRVKEGVTNC